MLGLSTESLRVSWFLPFRQHDTQGMSVYDDVKSQEREGRILVELRTGSKAERTTRNRVSSVSHRG